MIPCLGKVAGLGDILTAEHTTLWGHIDMHKYRALQLKHSNFTTGVDWIVDTDNEDRRNWA